MKTSKALTEQMLPGLSIHLSHLKQEDSAKAVELLYHAYYYDTMFQQIFDVRDAMYERHLRALFKEETEAFWEYGQPFIGAFVEDELIGIACVNLPESPLGGERFWNWRMKMLLSTGVVSTSRLLEKERRVAQKMPEGPCHQLSLIAVEPKYQKQGVGEVLLSGVDSLLQQHSESKGCGVLVSDPDAIKWFKNRGYQLRSKLEFANFTGQLLFRERKL